MGTTTVRTALVIGAGIIGASIAYRLAKAGVSVTILDRAGPSAGATSGSWAWINAVAADTKPYFDLRQAAIAAHHDLEQELSGRLTIDWVGTIGWDPDLCDDEWVDRLRDWGHAGHLIDEAEARRLEPALGSAPDRILHCPDDGLVHATDMTDVLLQAALDHNARIVVGEEVEALLSEDGKIVGVRTTNTTHRADVTVAAAGIGTEHLLKTADISLPMGNSPGLIAMTRPLTERMRVAIWTPDFYLKQLSDGRISIVDGSGRLEDPTLIDDLIEKAQTLLPGLGDMQVEQIICRTRPIPEDGKPVIGQPEGHPGLYVAVMHSGVTLAPLVGRLAMREILEGTEEPLLEAFRLQRFALNPG